MLILRLVTANSIEEEIVARANHKLDIDGKVIQAGKFDHRSTDEDREAFLVSQERALFLCMHFIYYPSPQRSLLEHKEDDTIGKHDYTDDDELNAILTRSEQDLVIFEQIDAQREQQENEYYRRRGLRGTHKPPRLMQEDELPGDFLNTVSIIQDNALSSSPPPATEYGRNQRRRFPNEIQYDDGLSEEEWLRKLEVNGVGVWSCMLCVANRMPAFRRSRMKKWKMKKERQQSIRQQRKRGSDVDHHQKYPYQNQNPENGMSLISATKPLQR